MTVTEAEGSSLPSRAERQESDRKLALPWFDEYFFASAGFVCVILAAMSELLRQIAAQFAETALLDRVNFVLGVIGVWLMIRRKLAAFPVGLAAVAVQGVLFYRGKFYADATLQVFFFAALTWGWWRWVREGDTAPERPIARLQPKILLAVLAGALGVTAVWALALQQWTDAPMPWRDAFIAAFSIAAQVLQVRRNLENWPLWVAVNTVAIVTYWLSGWQYTSLLYGVYLGLAFVGWRNWRRTLKGGGLRPGGPLPSSGDPGPPGGRALPGSAP